MGIEQAETQENRQKCNFMTPEKQTQFKDETEHLLKEKFLWRGLVGKPANRNTEVISETHYYSN